MVRFRQSLLVSARATAGQRCRRCAFAAPCSLFGVLLFVNAAIVLNTLNPVGRSAVVTTAGAAEGPVDERPMLGQFAPQQGRCLSRQEQRARIVAHDAIPLGKAVRAVKGRGDLLRARLCERHGKLLYLVTILGHSGKVQRLAIDARTGMLAGSRP